MSAPSPGKVETSAPKPSKKRTLPFGHAEDTLTETASRTVVEQYLKQRPERLGALIRSLERKDRHKALKSLQHSDILGIKTGYEHGLAPSDSVAVINFHDSSADSDYAILKVSELDEDFAKVLEHWWNAWLDEYDTPDKRSGQIEHDGSAQLDTDYELDPLSDAIEAYVDELQNVYELGEEEGEDPEPFDSDGKMETLREDITEYLGGGSWVKLEPQEKRPAFMYTPKITIRYQSE